jgi:hypothetical protein
LDLHSNTPPRMSSPLKPMYLSQSQGRPESPDDEEQIRRLRRSDTVCILFFILLVHSLTFTVLFQNILT